MFCDVMFNAPIVNQEASTGKLRASWKRLLVTCIEPATKNASRNAVPVGPSSQHWFSPKMMSSSDATTTEAKHRRSLRRVSSWQMLLVNSNIPLDGEPKPTPAFIVENVD